jgi:dipeptidyl aminopeptidase/acylaminoacyl peptidase
MPNPRGSGGYGEKHRRGNYQDLSGKEWDDCNTGVDAVINMGIGDPERLGIMGWSYGGHLTYWGITQTDRFKAGSAGAGANNLISMYSQTDLPGFYSDTYFGFPPWERADFYWERSSLSQVAKVKTPLLIQVGENDRRVPKTQSIEYYTALKDLGVPTELVIYPRQPHGVREPKLVVDLLQRNLDWFKKWVLEGGQPSTNP